jgi:large subunit ribosomal protein L23
MKKSPYEVILHRYLSEKSQVLSDLHKSNSNKSVARCQSPKYTFVVDPCATKQEIAAAVEQIYQEKGVRVAKVNTINVKPKRKVRYGRPDSWGKSRRKAIVTLHPGSSID